MMILWNSSVDEVVYKNLLDTVWSLECTRLVFADLRMNRSRAFRDKMRISDTVRYLLRRVEVNK